MSNSITITTTITEKEGADGKTDFRVKANASQEGDYTGSIADTLARILFTLAKKSAHQVGNGDVRLAWETLLEAVNEAGEEHLGQAEYRRIPLSTLDAIQTLLDPFEEEETERVHLPKIGDSVEELTAEIVSALPMGARFRDNDGDHFVRVEDGILLVTRIGLEGEPNSSSKIFGPYTRVEESETPQYQEVLEATRADTPAETPSLGDQVDELGPELILTLPFGTRFIDNLQLIWIKACGGMRLEGEEGLFDSVRGDGPYTRIRDLPEDEA